MNTTQNKIQVETETQDLESLLISASLLLDEIASHPHYKRLLQGGYSPDLNIADAQTAISYLEAEV
jgi:hypothetical protein